MTQLEVDATKEAIEVLRSALARLHYTFAWVPLECSIPLWTAAYHLFHSLPDSERKLSTGPLTLPLNGPWQ